MSHMGSLESSGEQITFWGIINGQFRLFLLIPEKKTGQIISILLGDAEF